MKKNIGFIPMDSVLEEWLLEKLMKEPPKSDCAEDLLSGIRVCSAERWPPCC